MKRVVSVSLGSSRGDFQLEQAFDGARVQLSREGMDGDIERARQKVAELDGRVDAIGLGGIDVYVYVCGQKFVIGDGLRLAETAKRTPVVDGSVLKDTLERRVIQRLAKRGRIKRGDSALMVSALDRFGMAESLVECGCRCVFGDLIFLMGIDFPLTSLKELGELAEKYRSRLASVPFHMLYPTGGQQDERKPEERFARYYDAADLVAGDRHLLMRHMPERLDGKGVVTTTTRPDTVETLKKAGASWLATTTPEMNGLSSGTNLMEALLVALAGKDRALTSAECCEWIERLQWTGSFHNFEQ